MNAKELRTLREAAKRLMPDAKVTVVEELPGTARVELPYSNVDGKPVYFFVGKRASTGKFSAILHVESIGILAVESTLALLQKLLRTYGLLLSQEAVIIEENTKIPLHQRLSTMSQAALGLDGIRRLWKVEYDRRDNAESKGSKPTSNTTDN